MRPVGKLAGLLIVVCVVLVSHLPELGGVVSCNPIFRDTQLQMPFASDALMLGRCDIDANAGGTVQALGHLSAEQWLHGQVPWWNHFTGIGLPLAAEMQSTSLFLPFVLLLHFEGGMLWMKISLQVFGGWFAFLVMREMRLAPIASVLGGVLFALNSTQAWFADAPEQPVAFLPMLIYGIERCRPGTGPSFSAGVALVTAAVAMSLYAGFPETAFADGMLALLWTLVAISSMPTARAVAFGVQVATGGIAGLMIASPLVLEFLATLRQSAAGMHAMAIPARADPQAAAAILFPSIYGPPDGDDLRRWSDPYGYFGTAIALLGLIGFASRPLDRLRVVLFAWIAAMLATAFGAPVVSPLVRSLPLFDLLVFSRYVAASTSFAAIVLACLAIDDRTAGRRLRVAPALAIWFFLSVLVIWLGRTRVEAYLAIGSIYRLVSLGGLVLSVAVAGLLIAGLRGGGNRVRMVILAMAVGIDALAAFMTPELAGARRRDLDLAPIRFLASHLGYDRAYSMSGTPGANYGAYFGFGYLNTVYEPVLRIWDERVQRLSDAQIGEVFVGAPDRSIADRVSDIDRHRKELAAVGLKYLIVATRENAHAVHLPSSPTPAFSDAILTIYETDHHDPYFSFSQSGCGIVTASRDRQRVTCPVGARLLRRELAAPGWHATVDGRKAPLHVVDTVFQAIDIPAGSSTVRWSYRPAHARTSTILFLLGSAALASFVARAGRAGPRDLGASDTVRDV